MAIKLIDGQITEKGWDLLERLLTKEFSRKTYPVFFEGCLYWDSDYNSFVFDFIDKNDEYGTRITPCNFRESQIQDIHWCLEGLWECAYFKPASS